MQIIRLPEVVKRVGISQTTIWRWQKTGRFPRSIKLGANSIGWREEEIDEWIRSRPAVGEASGSHVSTD